jgi:hypothetical protein
VEVVATSAPAQVQLHPRENNIRQQHHEWKWWLPGHQLRYSFILEKIIFVSNTFEWKWWLPEHQLRYSFILEKIISVENTQQKYETAMLSGKRTAFLSNRTTDQCCGSGMFIPDPGSDFFPSRIRTVSIPDPGSASKNLSILTQKKLVSKLQKI